MGYHFQRPDEAAMERLLSHHPSSPEGAILRLAWLQGLSRAEITGLTWDQADLENRLLLLPDRTVPLDPGTEACLRQRRALYANDSDHVVVSDRDRRPMPPESVSRLARRALNSGGIGAGLMDLRHDFVVRQIENHGWPYAARVSGMAVATLRDVFSPYLRAARSQEPAPPADKDEREYLLWRIVQQEGSSPAGLALWMGWQLRMQPGQIAALTWEQVDFQNNLLRLPDRELPMGSRLRRMLSETWARRKDPAEPQVFTAPTTGRPMDLARLTTVTRTALIRGGLEHVNLRNLHTWAKQDDQAERLMAQAEKQGFLTREDVTAALGVSKSTARQQLLRLREAGKLVRVGTRYYPAGTVVPPEEHLAAIRDYLLEHGSGRRRDFLELLHVPPEQGTRILSRLVEQGELTLAGRRYRLPDKEI